MTLVYTDSPNGTVGMIDLTNPASPMALGSIDVGGEPTAVVIQGQTAYVGVNTSESYTKPSGNVAVIDINAKKITGRQLRYNSVIEVFITLIFYSNGNKAIILRAGQGIWLSTNITSFMTGISVHSP